MKKKTAPQETTLVQESVERRHQGALTLEAGGTPLSAEMRPLAEKMIELKRLEGELKQNIADQWDAVIAQLDAEGIPAITMSDGPDIWEISVEEKRRGRCAKMTKTPKKEDGAEDNPDQPHLPMGGNGLEE